MQHSAPCWAADTTGRGASTTLYFGGGHVLDPNNETQPNEYDEYRTGIGAVGYARLKQGDLGPFLMLAGTFELEALAQTVCNWCSEDEVAALGTFHTEQHWAGRAGLGYSFEYVELRGGVLFVQPDPQAAIALPLMLPEVLARFGFRDVGWFELGVGAYDASTALRPGVFLGGAGTIGEGLRLGGHVGLHFPNLYCCISAFPPVGPRTELNLEWDVSPSLVLTGSGAVMAGLAGEVAAKLTLLL